MSIYFQHVGERGGLRDFPKSIGSPQAGLREFQLDDLPEIAGELEARDVEAVNRSAPSGFQVWGIPSGAQTVIKNLRVGDWLLLLMSDGPGGEFYYGGKVIFRPEREQFELSRRIWGEARFPLIALLQGRLTNYPWEKFRRLFGYAENWRLSGNTYRLKPERISVSPFESEEMVIEALLGIPSAEPAREFTDLLDQVELMIPSLEGRRLLREHIARERDPVLIRRFKERLSSFECKVCGFDFQNVYGPIGRNFIEAHHVEPIGQRAEASLTKPEDLIAVCSNCHRMMHRRVPPYTRDEMGELLAEAMSRAAHISSMPTKS